MRREDFPILEQQVNNYPLIYFDNAATTQKPNVVIQSLVDYYSTINSNIHRGIHSLSMLATMQFEEARENVKEFINAAHTYEIIFTKGTTDSINLVASSFAKQFLCEGSEVIITEMEHHSNIVPWQLACEEKKAILKVLPMDSRGNLHVEKLKDLITEKTKIISVTHVSNALGTINPIKEIVEIAHLYKIPVFVDGAQAVSHIPVDVQYLDCDFYAFSGHKMYAPMGIGVLYGKEKWLEILPPYQGGGEMIEKVTFEKTTYGELPFKFEAGTPNVADVIGLNSAINYINEIGLREIYDYEHQLLEYATEKLSDIEGLKLVGTADEKSAIISFNLNKIHSYDAGFLLDKYGIALRTGHHCAQPVMDRLGIDGTLRVSFALYNTKDEIDKLVEAIWRVRAMLL
ncbi:MAG TPA: cysteine desulfurase [Bacteroidales bacterium]|nr:cysteine desulfurase [Bacteroidales bacterium]HQA86084.1 cysteine desulfurase [Bacteroidales bacterium]